jgi:hypothetical protein
MISSMYLGKSTKKKRYIKKSTKNKIHEDGLAAQELDVLVDVFGKVGKLPRLCLYICLYM